jgi:GTP-binding protein HflX
LILNIFNQNARTKESKAQVQLATLEYLMPRLTGMWTHLERQMGGVGTRGGPGEKQIEIDRRIVRNEVKKLKKTLTTIAKQRINQTKQRGDLFKVSLVGYTNAGKSSIFNCITGYNTLVKDQLFATLETTTKKVMLPNKKSILLSDTVGFLRRLPHNLVASFRSTLREINNSDLIIKVIDISNGDLDSHINTINNTLKELKADKCKSLYVFNKIDLISDENTFIKINNKYTNPIMISAYKNLRMEDLYSKINEIALQDNREYLIDISQNESLFISFIYDNATILKRKDNYDFIRLKISCSEKNYAKIIKKLNRDK